MSDSWIEKEAEEMEMKIKTLEARIKELEEKHRLQLSAIMTIAYANTEEAFNRCLIDEENPYWTVAFDDVCETVKREMGLIRKNQTLEALLIEACEIISIARYGNVPNMEREVIYGKYLEREEIKKLLEGVKSEFN